MLPQVAAFILEYLRWRPVNISGTLWVLPLCAKVEVDSFRGQPGVPHRAMKDIVWRNYVIPEGATVIGSHW
jgi:hypothetical protein